MENGSTVKRGVTSAADKLFDHLVKPKPIAYMSVMSVRTLFFLWCVCFFGKLRILPLVDNAVTLTVGVSRDGGSGCTSDDIVMFLLYFFAASRIAVLIYQRI